MCTAYLAMKTIEDIDIKIGSLGTDAVLALLKDERATLHPDKSGGGFKSKKDEERYHFLNEAIDRISEKTHSVQLIPMSQLPAIIEAIGKSLAAQNNAPAIAEKHLKESFRQDLGRKYIGPKIGSGIFAGITGFLFTQSSALMSHPVVGPFFSSKDGVAFLGIVSVASVVMFIISWMQEKGEESKATHLLSEGVLHDIYRLMQSVSNDGLVEAHELRRAMAYESRGMLRDAGLFGQRLSEQMLDQILQIQLQRLVERQAIELVNKPGISRVYKLVV